MTSTTPVFFNAGFKFTLKNLFPEGHFYLAPKILLLYGHSIKVHSQKSDKERRGGKRPRRGEKRRREVTLSTLTLEDMSILAVQQDQGKGQDKKGSPGLY